MSALRAEHRNELPDGWRRVRLGDVCEPATGTRDPRRTPSEPFYYVDISSVDNRTKRITNPPILLGANAPSRARQIIRTGDVLVATTRPNLNAVAMVPPELDNQICSTGFCVLRSNSQSDPGFIFAYVQSPEFLQTVSELVKGALYPAVTDKQVRDIWLPLPSLAEQRRIAAAMTEQMAAVERARAAAEAQLEATKALPAAYLREVLCCPEAKKWPTKPLGDVGEIVSGVTLGRKTGDAETRPVPYLRVANVKDGYLDLSDVYEIEAIPAEINKLCLKYGDLLLTEGGDPDKLGRGTFWEEKIPECIHQNHIFRVRFDLSALSPQFVSAQIGSPYGKAYFLAHAKQTTGIATINRRVLAGFPLMVPPLAEQRRIAATLAELMAAAEDARAAGEAQLDVTSALSAALLRAAFAGNL